MTVLNAVMMGLFFFAGLLCKETALMLVAIVVFFEISAVGIAADRWQRRVATSGVLLVVALLYFAMRSHALGGANLGSQLGGLWERLANNIYIIPKYLSVLFYPANLNAAYSIPRDYTANSWWLVFAWLAIGVGVIYLLLKKNQPINFGLYWFAVTFIPISNIVQIPSSPMAERYIYMPAIGLWIVIAGVLEKLLAGEKARKTLLSVFALVCVLLLVVTFNRNRVWADNLALFNSMVVSQPEAAYGHYNLGNAYRETGDFTKAEQEWETTVALNQKHSQAWNQLGNIHLMYKSLTKAEHDFSMALRANATNSEAHYNLATVLEELGRPGEAVVHYEYFLRRVPPEHAAVIPEVVEKIRQLKPLSAYAE